MEDARKYLGVVAVIIAAGEATRYSPGYYNHKGMESIFGAPNIHQVWQAVEAMSLGARPVIPLGMRFLGLMMKDQEDYEELKKMIGIVPEEFIDDEKKERLVPEDAILSKKGADDEGGHGNQLKYAMDAYQELGIYDTVGHFQVHFAEHSPLALDRMINSAWVGYLEHMFGNAYGDLLVTATSRQDSTIAKKGNFIYDSMMRLLDICDAHKVIISLNPDSMRRGEALRMIEALETLGREDFAYNDMALIKALLTKYKGRDLHEMVTKVKDNASEKAEITEDLKKLSEHLTKLNEKALKVLEMRGIDKNLDKDYLLITYEQKRLALELEKKGLMPINANRAIFSRKVYPYIKDADKYSVFDPGNLKFEFLAWDIMRMLRRDYRHLPPPVRMKLFGLYPVMTVDVGYEGYKPVGWSSSGTKDRDTATKLLGEFEKQYKRELENSGIGFESDNVFLQVVSTKGKRLSKEFLDRFGEQLQQQELHGQVLINIDKGFIWMKDDNTILLLKKSLKKGSLADSLYNKLLDRRMIYNEDDGIVWTAPAISERRWKKAGFSAEEIEVIGKIQKSEEGQTVEKLVVAMAVENMAGRVTQQNGEEIREELYTLLNFSRDYTQVDTDTEVSALKEFKYENRPGSVLFGAAAVQGKKIADVFTKESKKGGVVTDLDRLAMRMPVGVKENEDTLKKMAQVYISEGEGGVKAADDVRLFDRVNIDLDSKVGFYVYLRNAEATASYIGRGWGLRGNKERPWKENPSDIMVKVHSSVLVDHKLKDKNRVLLLPIYNHKLTDTFTSILGDSKIENSVVFPGSGIPLRVEGGRNALVNVTLKNTVVPEGRRIAAGKAVDGLMNEERELITRLYHSSEEEGVVFIKRLLSDKENKGRFTSVAAAVLALPDKRELLDKIGPNERKEVDARIGIIEPVLGRYLNMLFSGQMVLDRFSGRSVKDFHTLAFESPYIKDSFKLDGTLSDEDTLMAYLLGYDGSDRPLSGVGGDYFAGLFSHGEKKNDKVYANYVDYTVGVVRDELRYFAEVLGRKELAKNLARENGGGIVLRNIPRNRQSISRNIRKNWQSISGSSTVFTWTPWKNTWSRR